MSKPRYSVWIALFWASLWVAACSDDGAGAKDSAPPAGDQGVDQALLDQGQDQLIDQTPAPDSSPDSGPASAWQAVGSASNGKLQAIWGSGPNNIFVVGKEGYILSYDGGNWRTMASPTQNDLFAVWGQGDRVYAAGTNVILVYDQAVGHGDAGGTPSWDEEYTSSWNSVTFRGLWGTAQGDLWAVGERGQVRYRGHDDYWWDSESVETSEHLNAITGFGEELFVVGDKGTILHWTAGEWQEMDSGTGANLTDIWGVAADDLYVCGLDGVVLHYNGATWSKLATGTQVYFRAIWGSASDDIYVAGESLFGESEEAVLHYDGSSWQAIGAAQPLAILDLWGSSADNLYALTKMTVLHYEATAP